MEKETNMELAHVIMGSAWFFWGAVIGIKGSATQMLICFAIGSIWLATI